MKIHVDLSRAADYETFLKVKAFPKYRIVGRTLEFPDEYADRLGIAPTDAIHAPYRPSPFLFDYQAAIAAMAIRKRKFAAFVEPGYGKTNIYGEFAIHVESLMPRGRCILMVTPSMVVDQTIDEYTRFYGDRLPIRRVTTADLPAWLDRGKERIGITNYEALTPELRAGRLFGLIPDESSIMKSMYGAWGTKLIELGRGLDWKLAGTGTPAPNDRIEYANHAVFLDHYPTTNAFLARFFVNRGQTDNRWELKPHALEPFYRALSHWCIFLTNPATYGWKDNCGTIPPIHVHVEPVGLTQEQTDLAYEKTGTLFASNVGGITSRSVLSQIAKGCYNGRTIETNKTAHIQQRVASWPSESTIIWCKFNAEQDAIAAAFPKCANISGDTPMETRLELIRDFKAGRRKVLVSKPKVLGFGLNLQIATRQIFSGLQDSYEEFFQAVKRSNRVGSKLPLNVHIPVTDIERPMIETVLAKARRVQQDTEEQERIFRSISHVG